MCEVTVVDALNHDLSDMEQETENDLLEVMKIALTKPFTSGPLTENVLYSRQLPNRKKRQYLQHISAIARMGINTSFYSHKFDRYFYWVIYYEIPLLATCEKRMLI